MQYDGEITLEIDDAAFATATRNRLFGHWNQPVDGGGNFGWQYAQWNGTAVANAGAFAAGTVPLNETRIVPLGYQDFIHPQSFESWRQFATNGGFLASAYF
ncbi:MAG: hypothetical protein HUJ11_09055, partial [Arenibacter algicola]|nr:hypothetical protein [Arenibacter algicola]